MWYVTLLKHRSAGSDLPDTVWHFADILCRVESKGGNKAMNSTAMPLKTLASITTITMGQSPPGESYNTDANGLPFFQGKAEFSEKFPTVGKWCTAPTRIAEEGDILMSVRAPVGPVNIAPCKCCIGRGLASIRPDKTKVDRGYLWHFFGYLQPQLSNQGQGSTFAAINRNDVEQIQIPLPPLPEQKRIAAILDKADAIRRKRAEARQLTDTFLQSVFIDMFGDPVTNPMGWPCHPLGTLCTIRRGASPRPISAFLGGTIPWIKIGDCTQTSSIYVENTREKVTEAGAAKSVYLEPGSLIFANCGVSLGFARILKIGGCIHDGWLSFEDTNPSINKVFLLKLLNSITNHFQQIAPDGTQPNLNTGIMKSFAIPLPPIEEQEIFASVVEKHLQICSHLSALIKTVECLHNSLLRQAFVRDVHTKKH